MATVLDDLIEKGRRAQRVVWTDEEWLQLAKQVRSMRRKRPGMAIVTLVRRAQSQLPRPRQREGLSTAQIKPLLDQLQKWDDESRTAVEELDTVRTRLAELELRPTRDQVLEQLGDEELAIRFRDRFLNMLTPADIIQHYSTEELLSGIESAALLGHAVERSFRDMMARDVSPTVALPAMLVQHLMQKNGNGHNGHSNNQPKPIRKQLVFLGLKSEQQRRVADRIGDLAHVHCVDKDRADKFILPDRVDFCFVWLKFTPRKYMDVCKSRLKSEQIQTHVGGLNELIEKALRVCTK